MHILNVFGGRTSALYIESMNLHCSLCTFPGNPRNGIEVLVEQMLLFLYSV